MIKNTVKISKLNKELEVTETIEGVSKTEHESEIPEEKKAKTREDTFIKI